MLVFAPAGRFFRRVAVASIAAAFVFPAASLRAEEPTSKAFGAEAIRVEEDDEEIRIETNALKATIRKKGYVSGIAGGSLVDKKTGAADLGFGLDIVDWVMAPGSDEAYRDRLPDKMTYEFGNAYHGDVPKRCLEGPQICTQVKELSPHVVRGENFVAVEMEYAYELAAPGREPGSRWKQTIVFLPDARYVLSSDEVTLKEGGEEVFLRTDLPGHIKHEQGDAFSEIYLSYLGRVPSSEFAKGNFAPQAKFHYFRDDESTEVPERMIRAYRVRGESEAEGPWLAGMTLDPEAVYEGWCHQRGYVCMIQEIGGRDYEAGDKIEAAYAIGWFDSIEEMEQTYDRYRGVTGIDVTDGKLTLERNENE